MSSLHHQRDQSYRIPRRKQAGKVQAISARLMEEGRIQAGTVHPAISKLTPNRAPCKVKIVSDFSQGAAMAATGRTGVLIFGSAKKPGGGWLNGAKAQEEDISLASTWGTQAAATRGFYDARENTDGMGPDRVIIASGLWLTNPHGAWLDRPQMVVFADIAAPNRANPAMKKVSRELQIDHLARRLATALEQWSASGVDTAVMGAIGCGVFQWTPEDSALALRMAIGHYYAKGLPPLEIILAMPDPSFAAVFSRVLTQPGIGNPSAKGKRP